MSPGHFSGPMIAVDAEARAGRIVLYTHGPHSYMVCGVTPSVPLPRHPPPASHPLTPQVSVCDPLGLFVASFMTPSQQLAHRAELVPLLLFCTGEMRLRGSESHPWPPKSFHLVPILFNSVLSSNLGRSSRFLILGTIKIFIYGLSASWSPEEFMESVTQWRLGADMCRDSSVSSFHVRGFS